MGDDDTGDDDLLRLPEDQISGNSLARLWTIRGETQQRRALEELMNEKNGMARPNMLFPENDPSYKQRSEEERRRREHEEWLRAMDDYRERSDRMLARIEEYQHEIEKRRKEIEDRALWLKDGRRVYVDGEDFRDEHGRLLEGSGAEEARGLKHEHPDAATWTEKQQIDYQAEEAERLRQTVEHDRQQAEQGGNTDSASQKLSDYEKELQRQMEQKAAQTPVNFGAADYMAAWADDYQISSQPEFSRVASRETAAQITDTRTESSSADNNKVTRPDGAGAFKPG
jgi:hypothetical protein